MQEDPKVEDVVSEQLKNLEVSFVDKDLSEPLDSLLN
jgi:hypothetical protein